MKKIKGRIFYLPVLLLIIGIFFSPLTANKAYGVEALDIIIEDGAEETSFLEISPLEDGFTEDLTDREEGLQISPLKIDNQKAMRFGARSVMPSKFDLRQQKRVTGVKDQGTNGSCWAFATYGAMESYMTRFGNYDFSEKHLRNKHGFDWTIDDGGNRDLATAYFARWEGPVAEKDDPYDPVISISPNKVRRMFDIDKVIYLPDVTNAYETEHIKWAIMEYGGIYTTINGSRFYENKDAYSYYNPGGGRADHAVTIVGWDDNFSRNAFTSRAPGNGAWIVKNSWGPAYMEGGYYYVSYHDAFIGRSNAVFIPKRHDPNGRIYQHDPLGATRSVGYNQKGYMANIYRAVQDEKLYEVGLFNLSNNTKYEIYVVRDIDSTGKLSNNRELIASGYMSYPGYYTLETEHVDLNAGEQFAIVAYLDSSSTDYRFPMAIETRIPGYSSQASANPGETFISSNGQNWVDLNRQIENASGCIKAITTSGEIMEDLEPGDIEPIDPEIYPSGIEFAQGTVGYIEIDKKGKLTPIVRPREFEDIELKFSVSDKDIAYVNEEGVVYPIKAGNVNIIAESVEHKINAKYNLQVVNKGIRIEDREMLEVIGDNDFDPSMIPDPEPEPEPEPEDNNDNPFFEYDPKIARMIRVKKSVITINEDEEYNLKKDILVYPETAEVEFRYESADLDILDVDREGNIIVNKPGQTRVKIISSNGLDTFANIMVVKNYKTREYFIDEISNSPRKAGIFTIFAKARENDHGYTGPAKLTLNFDEKTIERIIYFHRGTASSKFNGFQVGVWRKDFNVVIELKDQVMTYDFSY